MLRGVKLALVLVILLNVLVLFSNQTVPAAEAPASDLLFHPANFLEVDENEDSQEQAEVEAQILAETVEAAEKVLTCSILLWTESLILFGMIRLFFLKIIH